MFVDKDYGLVSSKTELDMLRRLNSEIVKWKHKRNSCQTVADNLFKCPAKKHTECETKYNKE